MGSTVKEDVDIRSYAVFIRSSAQNHPLSTIIVDKQMLVWGSQINVARFDFLFVNCIEHGHFAYSLQLLNVSTEIRTIRHMLNNEHCRLQIFWQACQDSEDRACRSCTRTYNDNVSH